MRNRATKAEAKVLEKLARSAAAEHLYDGIVYRKNYEAHEAAHYWRTYKHEPWELCCSIFNSDLDIGKLETLLVEHDQNIKKLEDRLVTELAEHPGCYCNGDKEYCGCPCHNFDVLLWPWQRIAKEKQ